MNKSQVVREYIAKHKRAKAGTVVAALTEKGIEVRAALVYQVRGKNKTKRGTPKTSASPKTKANGHFSLDSLLAAKKLVAELGSIKDAKAALTALAKLAEA